jgi:hypothetical protein
LGSVRFSLRLVKLLKSLSMSDMCIFEGHGIAPAMYGGRRPEADFGVSSEGSWVVNDL